MEEVNWSQSAVRREAASARVNSMGEGSVAGGPVTAGGDSSAVPQQPHQPAAPPTPPPCDSLPPESTSALFIPPEPIPEGPVASPPGPSTASAPSPPLGGPQHLETSIEPLEPLDGKPTLCESLPFVSDDLDEPLPELSASSASPPLDSSYSSELESESHGGAGEEAGPSLDQEMEKVFDMAGDKFDLAKISSPPDSERGYGRSASERDFQQYRKKSYPHVYPPLKSMRRPSRLASPRPSISEEGAPEDLDVGGSRRASEDAVTLMLVPPDEETEDVDREAEPSHRAATVGAVFDADLYSDMARRVQFSIGESPEDRLPPLEEGKVTSDGEEGAKFIEDRRSSRDDDHEKRKKKHRHSHHHHHHHRKLSLQEDLVSRKRVGSEFLPTEIGRRSSIRPDEAAQLDSALHVENLESHRFDDVRRYKMPTRGSTLSVIKIGRKDGDNIDNVVPVISDKKTIDHSPHEVFVQLDELSGLGEDREWKETARWIKYEEDVEEGLDRWGQPHVASLSFHSLLNLRRCLETGVVLLDLQETELPGVAYRIVEQMVVDDLIAESDRGTVLRALLLRHRHVAENDRFRFGVKRNFSSYASLQNLHNDGKPRIVPSTTSMDHWSPNKAKLGPELKVNGESHHLIDVKEEQTFTSSEDIRKAAAKESILRKIPVGAEATTVLVGAVEFLEQPTIAFARLAEGIFMPSITEVTIPVRFMFILLGPPTADLDYHEIGRSISTLMSNSQFHNVAYKAEGRKELLSAINEFLDDSIVLPPGDWQRKALLPFSELKAKSEAIRRRRNKQLNAEKQFPDESKKALLPGDDDEKKPPYWDPLRRTRRPFGGLINDVRRRYPFYWSDIRDGLNLQCVAAAIFMYFAALSTAITFGGLMGDKTYNLIGIAETLVATSAAGILFGLLSGQPLVIVGTTGPLLLFDESLLKFCEANQIDFLPMRVYIGIWLLVIALVVAFLEGSVFVKLFTRFTEEIFASLISLLYIVESCQSLFALYRRHPLESIDVYCNGTDPWDSLEVSSHYSTGNDSVDLNGTRASLMKIDPGPTNQPNTALFCTILALGTFFVAYYLRQFRNSKFLGRSARRALGDFGVPLAIVCMVLLDYLNPYTYTEKLQVPEGLEPSNAEFRGWLISPGGLPIWVMFAACGPAILVYILIFMETNITELIIDKKERKLHKGSGFHLDIVLLCAVNLGSGVLGAPWMCAATVRSIAHVSALTVMSRTHAPGDSPHIIEVKEQRLSALLVAVMIGLSVLMSPLLRLVPMAVLFGVFLYMGVSSTNGIQFFDRLKLFFMPVKHHSHANYVRRVQTMKMHLFTVIQLLCLVVLWVVKSTPISLAFPFFLIMMVPLRAQLKHVFTHTELRALDSDEVDPDPDDPEGEPDFYTEAPLPG